LTHEILDKLERIRYRDTKRDGTAGSLGKGGKKGEATQGTLGEGKKPAIPVNTKKTRGCKNEPYGENTRG